MSLSIFSNTPSVTVTDNHGRVVRELAYYRHSDDEHITREMISFTDNSLAGFPVRIFSARQYELWRNDCSVLPNRECIHSLSGLALKTRGADDGEAVALNDIAGRPFLTINATGVSRRFQYEEGGAGRLLSISEQQPGEAPRIVERFCWAGHTAQEKEANIVGMCHTRYDNGGRETCEKVSITGISLKTTRKLLPEERDADWQGTEKMYWDRQLASEEFSSSTKVDATGAVQSQTDAAGNTRLFEYNRGGQLAQCVMRTRCGETKEIVRSVSYSAQGQVLQQVDGNGVATCCEYDPLTQLMTVSRLERPQGHPSGARVLMDLHYSYDPVGNITCIRDNTQKSRYWRNKKVEPENRYTYDSFYQLASATGREMASLSAAGRTLPVPISPISRGDAVYTGYERKYNYDDGGNLYKIQHNAPESGNNHTTILTISCRNNRAVVDSLTTDVNAVDSWFDAAGHQLFLSLGQRLYYTANGELANVSTVTRDNDADREWYRYGEDSQRLMKTTLSQTGNGTQKKKVVYLPELEIRTHLSSDNVTEALQVSSIGHARLMHWETGLPDSFMNDTLCFTYTSLSGHASIELDEQGLMVSREEYYPFGGSAIWNVRNETEGGYKFYRYAGKERDATGLYYYGLRYYQPWNGRWLSADPGGVIDGLNLFAMVHNNPVNCADEDGGASSLLSSIVEGIGGVINNGFHFPDISLPSFSLPGFSLPNFSLPDFSIMGIVRSTVGAAVGALYRKGYKKLLNHMLSKCETDEQKLRVTRGMRAVSIGVGVGLALAGVVATAGLAIPVAAGVVAAGSAIAGAIGYFAGPLSNAFARLAALMPVSSRGAGAVTAQFSNTVSGGNTASGVAAGVAQQANDRALKKRGRRRSFRINTGAEFGLGSGTLFSLLGRFDAVMSGLVMSAITFVSRLVERSESIRGSGEYAAMQAIEGRRMARTLSRYLGLRGGGLKARVARWMTEIAFRLAGSPITPNTLRNAAEHLIIGGQTIGSTLSRALAIETNNHATLRNLQNENYPPDNQQGWLCEAINNGWTTIRRTVSA